MGGVAEQGRRLVCWLPIAAALGIVIYFALPSEPTFWLCVCVGICAIIGVGSVIASHCGEVESLKGAEWRLWRRFVGGGIAAVGLGFLGAHYQAADQPVTPLLPLESIWLVGRVTALEPMIAHGTSPDDGSVDSAAQRWHIEIAEAVFESPWWVGMTPLQRRLSLTVRTPTGPIFRKSEGQADPLAGIRQGMYVRLRALVRMPAAPVWPDGYDGQRAAWFADRAGSGVVLSPITPVQRHVGLVSRFVGGGHLYWLRMRSKVAQNIELILPGQNGAIAAAILCGETGLVSPSTRQEYAAAGLAHILAVAGLHLGLVMGFIYVCASRILRLSQHLSAYWRCREIALLLSLSGGGLYIGLTGGHIPGMRALGMAALVVLASLLQRRVISLRALALVALGFEIMSPVIVLDVSFQMSFAAVMTLIAGHEALRAGLGRLRDQEVEQHPSLWGRAAQAVAMLIGTSLLAGGATLPLSMAYFGAFQPWFVLANIVVVPLMGIWVMPMGIIALFLLPLGLASAPLHLMGWGIEGISHIARYVARLPYASWPVPSFPSWGIGAFLLGLAVLCLWRGMARFVGIGIMTVGILSAWLVPRPVMIVAAGLEPALVVRQTGAMQLVEGRSSQSFIRQELQRALGWSGGNVSAPICGADTCYIRLKEGQKILWRHLKSGREEAAEEVVRPEDERLGTGLCQKVVLEVHVTYQRAICPMARQLGPRDIQRDGSWAVYDDGRGNVRLVSDRYVQGRRLWVKPVGFRGVPPLPLAQAE